MLNIIYDHCDVPFFVYDETVIFEDDSIMYCVNSTIYYKLTSKNSRLTDEDIVKIRNRFVMSTNEQSQCISHRKNVCYEIRKVIIPIPAYDTTNDEVYLERISKIFNDNENAFELKETGCTSKYKYSKCLSICHGEICCVAKNMDGSLRIIKRTNTRFIIMCACDSCHRVVKINPSPIFSYKNETIVGGIREVNDELKRRQVLNGKR